MFSVKCLVYRAVTDTLRVRVVRVQGLGFRAWGLGLRVWDLGFRVCGLGCRVQVQGLRKRARNERGEGILKNASSGSLGLEGASDVGCARQLDSKEP